MRTHISESGNDRVPLGRLTLGIETAILSGSIAVFDGETSVSSADASISRAETLLGAISDLLAIGEYRKEDIGKIVVSLGPGSFTGIRIGIATAIGLSSALGISCVGFSTLAALASKENKLGAAVVPLGRGQFAVRRFGDPTSNPIKVLDLPELVNQVGSETELDFFLPHECSVPELARFPNVIYRPESTAARLCALSADGSGSPDLVPQYIRSDD